MRANLIEEVHELVCAESVWLDYATPVWIERYAALRADSFAPVIFIGETTAGPANVRNFQRFECGDDIVANAARVRNLGVGTDPDAFVNTVAEVFGELTEDVAVDLRACLGNVNGHLDFLCCRHRHSHSHSEQSQAGKK